MKIEIYTKWYTNTIQYQVVLYLKKRQFVVWFADGQGKKIRDES